MKILKSYKIFESLISRKKDHNIFNYSKIINTEWRKIIQKAQKFQKINFDLENNDTTGQKKTLLITKNLRKDQPVKYEINLELCKAGGDWEYPVMYFKIEFTKDYGIIRSKHQKKYVWDLEHTYDGLYNNFVLIPGPEINKIVKVEKGYTAYTNDSIKELNLDKKDIKLNEKDYKKAWKWIEELFEKLAEERHEMLD